MSSNHWGMKFQIFRIFFKKIRALTIKTASFPVQMVKFVFKRSNFNSNRPITSHRITAASRPQRQAVVRAVPSGSTPAWTVPSNPGRRQPHRPVLLPRPRRRAVAPDDWAVTPSERALPPATRTSLISGIHHHS
jgi:hypothetical protein